MIYDWQLIAEAIQKPGIKIRADMFAKGYYIYFNGTNWYDAYDNIFYPNFVSYTWSYFDYSQPKLITWYRPKIVWYKDHTSPIKFEGDDLLFWDGKNLTYWFGEREVNENEIKVLEWETIEAYSTWGQCE